MNGASASPRRALAAERAGQSSLPSTPARLEDGFFASAARVPNLPAVTTATATWSYRELSEMSASWATALHEAVGGRPQRVGIFANKELAAYAGILAGLRAGATVVPLNPEHPDARLRKVIRSTRLDAVLAAGTSPERIRELVSAVDDPPRLVLPFVPRSAARFSGMLNAVDIERCAATDFPRQADDGRPAYLLFTSGTTGEPKGIPIYHRNVTHFLRTAAERYAFTELDRFSQTFNQTFDLSFFDMFMAWGCGAGIFTMGPRDILEPARFITRQSLTVWFSVPSLIALMRQRRALVPGRFDTLRWSLFCGEALPERFAQAWHEAAPGSVIENLYGPTEATLACMSHRWVPGASGRLAVNGNVPIGVANPGLDLRLVDDDLRTVPAGSEGELCVAGPQVFSGYWSGPGEGGTALCRLPDDSDGRDRWYRTGDVVREIEGSQYAFVRRLDTQVKVRGHRVEIAEIEAVLNGLDDVIHSAVVLAHPDKIESAELVAYVVPRSGTTPVASRMIARMRVDLPAYMVPTRWSFVESLPLNGNGKIDRKRLTGDARESLIAVSAEKRS
ncbi:amino acid adenylation domain-containing protein [Streptomyces sp. BK022]|uniref:AMP-binding protein n=1 Tax=Streptomyces sp. BK022 TaxID=2512123 RepID=UPI0010E3CE55|nr:AMP-binding protein [Streptomyces sp. BK022]RZU45743.1 amino acid adenylation domain-containing protein [Streptomyces sp. BK022]